MNQSDCSGKTLKPWPVFVDHYTMPLQTELSRRNLYIGDLIHALANGISQADMYMWINKKISSNDLRILAKIHFQELDIELYGNARTHEVTINPLQPLLPPQWMWESDEWSYMLSDEADTFCPAKGRWHWDYATPSRGMRALGTAAMSVFFPGQTTLGDQAAFHHGGIVLAQRFFAMTYKSEPFILNSDDIIGLLINDNVGYEALKFLLKPNNQ